MSAKPVSSIVSPLLHTVVMTLRSTDATVQSNSDSLPKFAIPHWAKSQPLRPVPSTESTTHKTVSLLFLFVSRSL